MIQLTTRAKAKEDGVEGKEHTFKVDLGENLNDMCDLFGEGVIVSRAQAAIRVDYHDFVRSMLVAGKTSEKIDEALATYKPGIRRVRCVDPLSKAKKAFGGLSAEEKTALLAELGVC